MTLHLLLLLNLVLAAMLCGLIWLVQLVHYPGFLLVGAEKSAEYQRHHTKSIFRVVVPLMLAELFLGGWLLFSSFSFNILAYLNYAAFGCLAIIWLATFGFAVPLHNRFSKEGYKQAYVRKLIRINWIRTVAWTLRLLLLFGMVYLYI
jgi:hypothetical protein